MSAVLGTARATRHEVSITDAAGELALDITLAKAPEAPSHGDIVLYVLDPEPILFGAACLHAYAGAGYYGSAQFVPEHLYRRLHIVGIGHAATSYSANEKTWDTRQLRDLRRRDFPPRNHPANDPERGHNLRSANFATCLCQEIFPFVENELLGLRIPPGGLGVKRVLLGASYSAALALQMLLVKDEEVDALILGSPSLPFDPELMEALRTTTTC